MKNKVCRTEAKSFNRSLPLALLLLCATLTASADENPLEFERYQAADTAIKLAFLHLYDERVVNWKIVAMLEKCKNEGLAKAVADKVPPLADEITNALAGVIQKEKSLSSLTPDDFGVIHAAVANTVVGFKTGLSSGLSFVFADKSSEEALCRVAVKKADEYLAK